MTKFESAKYGEEFITVKDYNYGVHNTNLYCPECEQAKLCIARKKIPHFRSNRRNEHHEDCQHYAEHINQKTLNDRSESDEPKDKKWLKSTVDSNLEACLRLMTNNPKQNLETKQKKINSTKSNLTPTKKSTEPYNRIRRIHIKNVKSKHEEYHNELCIVYGVADLEIRDINHNGNPIKKKQICFRINKEWIFSIFLGEKQTEFFNPPDPINPVNFAVFGKLVKNKGFINLGIKSTEHLKFYLQPKTE